MCLAVDGVLWRNRCWESTKSVHHIEVHRLLISGMKMRSSEGKEFARGDQGAVKALPGTEDWG